MATPLWRDIIADLGTAARASFTVAMGTTSNVVYSGIAHRLRVLFLSELSGAQTGAPPHLIINTGTRLADIFRE